MYLLQADPDAAAVGTLAITVVMVIILALIIIPIYIMLVRWVFRINKQIWYQQKALDVLTMIARKQGVTNEELDMIWKRKVD